MLKLSVVENKLKLKNETVLFCFSLDRTGDRNYVGRSLAQQKLRAKLCKNSRECTEARNKRQSEVAILETLKGVIDDFDLGVHFEIELIGGYTAFLTFSATPEKNYPKNIGSYHPVKRSSRLSNAHIGCLDLITVVLAFEFIFLATGTFA